ncbi:hypothetical protein K474DRAFT_1679845, partial [Panus rudis PR-1116 ss-1]
KIPGGYEEFQELWMRTDSACPYQFSSYTPATKVIATYGRPLPTTLLAPRLACESPINAAELEEERKAFRELQRLNTERTLKQEKKKEQGIKRRHEAKDEKEVRARREAREAAMVAASRSTTTTTTPSTDAASSAPVASSSRTNTTPVRGAASATKGTEGAKKKTRAGEKEKAMEVDKD